MFLHVGVEIVKSVTHCLRCFVRQTPFVLRLMQAKKYRSPSSTSGNRPARSPLSWPAQCGWCRGQCYTCLMCIMLKRNRPLDVLHARSVCVSHVVQTDSILDVEESNSGLNLCHSIQQSNSTPFMMVCFTRLLPVHTLSWSSLPPGRGDHQIEIRLCCCGWSSVASPPSLLPSFPHPSSLSPLPEVPSVLLGHCSQRVNNGEIRCDSIDVKASHLPDRDAPISSVQRDCASIVLSYIFLFVLNR